MEPILNNKAIKELFVAITALRTQTECKNFMRDLCTLSELESMAERLQVAKLVKQGIPYREIAKSTDSSTATVTRVAHWLNHGSGGYGLILHRLS